MSRVAAQNLLHHLARRWRLRRRVGGGLSALAILIPSAALAVSRFGLSPWVACAAVAGLVVVAALLSASPIDLRAVARHLDRRVPELEDSAELLLADPETLSPLARLQQVRAARALEKAEVGAVLPWRPVTSALRWLGGGLAMAALVWSLTPTPTVSGVGTEAVVAMPQGAAEVAGPLLRGVELRIEPPAYTGRPARAVATLDAEVEEGSRLRWTVDAAAEARRAVLRLDGEEFELTADGAGRFVGELMATRTRLYRLEIDGGAGFLSPTARLTVVADTPPELEIRHPPSRLEVDVAGRLVVEVEARDDYGVAEAVLVATLASGMGEMVEFREQRFAFAERLPLERAGGASDTDGAKDSVLLRRALDLEALGMVEGSELYLFAEAEDVRRPEPLRGRSATHVVRWPGARRASVALGAGLPVVQPPEFFRSQRQIILDTKKLLAEAPRLAEAEFIRRAQNLGLDQRALRMRYGGLLGDEFVDGRAAGAADVAEAARGVAVRAGETQRAGETHDDEHAANHDDHPADDHAGHDHAAEGASGFDDGIQFRSPRVIDLVPEEFAHLHDSEESSTFFTSEVLSTLKAALAEMWDAERHLRSNAPAEALPFEEAALELLKKAQQAERVYVQRVGFEAPVVKPEEARLTGELDKIKNRRDIRPATAEPSAPELRRALAALTAWRRGESDAVDPATLTEAARLLEQRAVDGAAIDLALVDRLRAWAASAGRGEKAAAAVEEILAVEGALWRELPEAAASPGRRDGAGELWESYRAGLGGGS